MESGRQDSNLRPPGPKPGALPTALRPAESDFPHAKIEKTIQLAKCSFKSYGLCRLNARDNITRTDKGEDGGKQSADIDEKNDEPIDFQRDCFEIISGGVEPEQAPLFLSEGYAERKYVADEQAPQRNEDGEVEEYAPHAAVGRTECLE